MHNIQHTLKYSHWQSPLYSHTSCLYNGSILGMLYFDVRRHAYLFWAVRAAPSQYTRKTLPTIPAAFRWSSPDLWASCSLLLLLTDIQLNTTRCWVFLRKANGSSLLLLPLTGVRAEDTVLLQYLTTFVSYRFLGLSESVTRDSVNDKFCPLNIVSRLWTALMKMFHWNKCLYEKKVSNSSLDLQCSQKQQVVELKMTVSCSSKYTTLLESHWLAFAHGGLVLQIALQAVWCLLRSWWILLFENRLHLMPIQKKICLKILSFCCLITKDS